MRTTFTTLLFLFMFLISEYGHSQTRSYIKPLTGRFDSTNIHTTELLKQSEPLTAIGQDLTEKTFHLAQNTPNPFTDHTLIQYILNTNGAPITLCIYDVLGNIVETLVDEKQKNSGAYAINYQANLRSGVYYCKLISGDRFLVIKMVCAR